ncbi:hypothetical protein SRHO_G00140180 [Serrasalmus rhombeus]
MRSGSVHATSIAASRVEQALSEVASSLQSSAPKQGPLHPWMTLAQIWLHAAEVYIGMLKPAEALACTLEAASLFPLSHNVLFMKGQVAELRGNTEEAKRWYEEALSISPTHVKSMQRLGLILHQLQRYSLAEKVLRDAVQVSSTAHSVWNSLGEVLQAQGNHAAATECFLTALELEGQQPCAALHSHPPHPLRPTRPLRAAAQLNGISAQLSFLIPNSLISGVLRRRKEHIKSSPLSWRRPDVNKNDFI